ncbi:MAG TPA: PGPGW domain-containing protein [Pseudomonadales bacterium]
MKLDLDQAGEVLGWATGLSLVALVATAVGVPWVVARLPSDYFTRPRRSSWRRSAERPMLALAVSVGKNLLGSVLVLLGVLMLITPGQGLLTLLIGLLMLNFPGKYRLERWLVRRPGVLRALNWLRRRRGQPPFEEPP